MVQRPRIEIEGGLYHVYNRVASGEPIFSDPEEAVEFIDTIRETKMHDAWTVLPWCVMSNHYHLVIRTATVPLWRGMHRVQNLFSRRFNRRPGRTKALRPGINVVTLVVILGVSALALAHSPEGLWQSPPDLGFGMLPLSSVELVVMPMVNVVALRAEDTEREGQGVPVAPRFATEIEVAYSLENSGTWETLGDGSRVWRLLIASFGALSLNLSFDRFELPEGAEFWVYGSDGSGVQGPYTKRNRNSVGGLWTAVIFGGELVAVLHVPKGTEADLRIASVNHGYRFLGEREASISLKRGACNVNVVCPQGDPWRDQIRSVARITISGMFLCTAQLVNNTAEDLTPYMLTAQHCIEQANQAPSVVTYWNYQSPECDDFAGGDLSQNQSGSTFISSYPLAGGSDFTLVKLDAQPQPSFNVYYSGWDARNIIPTATTTIHHPGGDEKSISIDNDPPTVTSYLGSGSPGTGTHFRVADWDVGTTEGGSSGSCLFDSTTKRCIGTLSGGYAACGNDDPDWYGRMHRHWTGGGKSETRLSDWLDPEDTGALTFPGTRADAIFADSFESGDTTAWSVTVPP